MVMKNGSTSFTYKQINIHWTGCKEKRSKILLIEHDFSNVLTVNKFGRNTGYCVRRSGQNS